MLLLGSTGRSEKKGFGLDIGHKTTKVVQLKKSGSSFRLVASGILPSPEQPFAKNGIKEKKKLIETIKKALSQFRIKTKAVTTALPESLVFTKIIQLPKMNKKELYTTVSLEAASFIPLEPDQIFLDFQTVGEIKNKYEVLVIATPKPLVLDTIDAIKQAGLRPLCIETKPLANARALITDPKEGTLILDVGAETTSLTIYDGRAIKFTATFDTGGNKFNEIIASTLSIKPEEAEEMKEKMDISKRTEKIKEVSRALQVPINSLVAEIGSGIKFYQGHREGAKVSKIILSGGGASLPGLIDLVRQGTGIKTERGNPWQKINNPPEEKSNLQLTTAIGLAMREEI